MSEQQIGDLLRRGSDHLPQPDLAGAALTGARRRHRRRATIAGSTVTAAVVAAAVLPLVVNGRSGPGHPQPAGPSPTPAAATGRISPPAPDASVVSPALDPDDIAALPTYDAGLPKSLQPDADTAPDLSDDPIDHAVAVTKADGPHPDDLEQGVFYALGADGEWRQVEVEAPADLTGGRGPALLPESLSPDGTKVALKGNTAVYVVDLADGSTTAVSTGRWAGMTAWQPDSRHLLVPLASDGFVVDVTTGDRSPAPWAADTLSGPFTGAYEPGGRLVHLADEGRKQRTERVVERDGDRGLLHVDLDELGQPVYLLPGAQSLAMSTQPMIRTDKGLHGRDDGLLVVGRDDYRTTAFLPVLGPEGYYRATDRLRPRTWLDDHTLLFSLRPAATNGDGTDVGEVFLAWDIKTGRVSRVAQTTLLWRSVSLLPETGN